MLVVSIRKQTKRTPSFALFMNQTLPIMNYAFCILFAIESDDGEKLD